MGGCAGSVTTSAQGVLIKISSRRWISACSSRQRLRSALSSRSSINRWLVAALASCCFAVAFACRALGIC
jgi:hypothetical protein